MESCNWLQVKLKLDITGGSVLLKWVVNLGFPAPPNTDLIGYHTYIDDAIPAESPYLYGLHPNAEIGFLTTTSENLFRTVFEMQPRDAGSSGGQVITREDKVYTVKTKNFENTIMSVAC